MFPHIFCSELQNEQRLIFRLILLFIVLKFNFEIFYHSINLFKPLQILQSN